MLWFILRKLRFIFEPTIEAALRLSDGLKLLQLKVLAKPTILETLNFQNLKGNKFLIFATYPVESLSSHHIRLIRKFEGKGYTVIIASNRKGAKKVLAPLLTEPWVFVFRRPFGRDFGCYKDCCQMLYKAKREGHLDIERVVFVNDSVFTFGENEDRLIDHLANPRLSFSGFTENYEFCYHVGSFLVGISGSVFMESKVQKFWEKYRPISTRRYSIHRGEFGLTKVISRCGYMPSVMLTVSDMKKYLLEQDYTVLLNIKSFMPRGFLSVSAGLLPVMDEALKSGLGWDEIAPKVRLKKGAYAKMAALNERTGLMGFNQDASFSAPFIQTEQGLDNIKLQMVRYREKIIGLPEADQKKIIGSDAKQKLVDQMLEFVFRGSQIHNAVAIILFMGLGVIKKDVVYRQLIEPFNLKVLLEASCPQLKADEVDAISAEMFAKGHPYSYRRGKKRLMYDWGFI